jgi:ribose/xylose/arabinose/galactoside ABC-type transport system permease subunit
MVIVVVAATFLLNKTFLGRYIYAIGQPGEAARLAGIKVDKIRLTVFLIAGICFGLAAMLFVARQGSAQTTMAAGSEFTAITAAVMGGIAIQGGEGKIGGCVVAAFILGILSNGMQLVGINVNIQQIVSGVILVAAMGLGMYQKQRSARALVGE